MAHYALLNHKNIVKRVITGKCQDESDADMELVFQDMFKMKCRQTSYNTFGGVHTLGGTPFRKNFASIGYTFDEDRDAFIPPKPKDLDSWVLNEDSCLWEAPIPYPDDGQNYEWNEETQSWDLITE
jgi:hypothetical protein